MLRTGILRNAPALFKRSTPATTLSRSRYYSSLRLPPKPNSILTNTKISTAFANLSLQKRFVANSVSNKPASDDLPHAALNAKEEAKTLASDIAKIIAGSNYHKASSHGMDGFSDITLGIASNVPKPILVTGLLGGLPYLGTAASTLYYARQAGQLATGLPARVDYDTAISLLEQAAQVQVTYGAVLLSFLGALHWGMEFAAYGGHQGKCPL
ncbi:hypothetical protein FRC03_004580 [Tulasnella sp. 419]|nr:hypothetical protein FRC03_004580 [Tulasnella sp. 419]